MEDLSRGCFMLGAACHQAEAVPQGAAQQPFLFVTTCCPPGVHTTLPLARKQHANISCAALCAQFTSFPFIWVVSGSFLPWYIACLLCTWASRKMILEASSAGFCFSGGRPASAVAGSHRTMQRDQWTSIDTSAGGLLASNLASKHLQSSAC